MFVIPLDGLAGKKVGLVSSWEHLDGPWGPCPPQAHRHGAQGPFSITSPTAGEAEPLNPRVPSLLCHRSFVTHW